MADDRKNVKIHLVTNEKIAETSSKGNQEKWLDNGKWYKLDQFGYEALSETLVSLMLEKSNVEEIGFKFVRYDMERMNVHGRERTGCVSDNFLKEGQSVVTLAHLFGKHLGYRLSEKLMRLKSDKQRIVYIAEETAKLTGLERFPEYLTMLFEIDSLFLNDDRHLNNIAVLERDGVYDYCPVFDNGAALLSNVQISRMDIEPKALITELQARPFNTTFTRQMNTARRLYGEQFQMPELAQAEIRIALEPLLEYYAVRDRDIIADRVITCILTRQKILRKN
ncbi:MAG: hypothetical protein IJX57_01035 [Clostridia bacterium]|nr:hypothetical protein [Clostridia bacterium]